MDKVIKESYKTLISIKPKNGAQQPSADDANDERKENLKKKYAKFTSQLLLSGGG
jgi:hypothetical protein